MYSLGVLLFTMFYGMPPVKHCNMVEHPPHFHEILAKLGTGNPRDMLVFLQAHPVASRISISPHFVNLLARLLNFDPA